MFTGTSLARLAVVQPRHAKWAIVVRVRSGRAYRIQLDSEYMAIGEVRLTWRRVFRPPNDRFANATAISGESGLARGNNYLARGEPGEPEQEPYQHPEDIASVWFTWTAPRDGTFTFSAKESSFGFIGAFVGIYAGDNVADLERITASAFSYPASIGASAGQTFYILVDSFWASVGRVQLRWNPRPDAPANDNFSARVNLTGSEGIVRGLYEKATMEIGDPTRGCGSVWYTWTAPETKPVLFIPGDGQTGVFVFTGEHVGALTPVPAVTYTPGWGSLTGLWIDATAGTQYQIAYNDCEFDPFGFSWNQGAPENDMFSAATVLEGWSGSVTGDNVLSTKEAGEREYVQRSVWYRWTPPLSGRATITTSGSTFDTELEIFRGTALDALTYVTADDNSGGPYNTSSATFDATAGTTYYVRVFGPEGSIVLNWNRSTGDTVPPVVSLTAPREGDSDGWNVGLEVDAYDNVGLEGVAFYARGELVGRDYSRPLRFVWDTRGEPDGPATLYAVARDLYGNETTSAAVTMLVDNTPPETTITSGPSGTIFARRATFTVESSEGGSSFQCSLDGSEFAPCPATAHFTWLSRGRHRLAVRAKDVAGNIDGTPAVRSWYVDP